MESREIWFDRLVREAIEQMVFDDIAGSKTSRKDCCKFTACRPTMRAGLMANLSDFSLHDISAQLATAMR